MKTTNHQYRYREVFYFKQYYLEFFERLKPEVQKKFNWTLQLIETQPIIPEKYFKHITNSNGFYEIRVESESNIFRVFAFFDQNRLIILINGFKKQSQKTPVKEIRLAEKIKHEYSHEQKEKINPGKYK